MVGEDRVSHLMEGTGGDQIDWCDNWRCCRESV